MFEQKAGEEGGDFDVDVGIDADRVAGGKHQAIDRVGDLRPQHARGVVEGEARADVDALLALGHRRLVTDRGDFLLDHGVEQGRFADVGDAHDHQAQRLDGIVAMRRQLLGERRHARHVARLLAADRHRLDAWLLGEMGKPGLGGDRIGHIGLVQQLEAGALAEGAQLVDHRIAGSHRQAGIEHLDDDIGHGQRFGRLLAGGGHVTGEPLDGHGQDRRGGEGWIIPNTGAPCPPTFAYKS